MDNREIIITNDIQNGRYSHRESNLLSNTKAGYSDLYSFSILVNSVLMLCYLPDPVGLLKRMVLNRYKIIRLGNPIYNGKTAF